MAHKVAARKNHLAPQVEKDLVRPKSGQLSRTIFVGVLQTGEIPRRIMGIQVYGVVIQEMFQCQVKWLLSREKVNRFWLDHLKSWKCRRELAAVIILLFFIIYLSLSFVFYHFDPFPPLFVTRKGTRSLAVRSTWVNASKWMRASSLSQEKLIFLLSSTSRRKTGKLQNVNQGVSVRLIIYVYMRRSKQRWPFDFQWGKIGAIFDCLSLFVSFSFLCINTKQINILH